jgi:hypothetical protein
MNDYIYVIFIKNYYIYIYIYIDFKNIFFIKILIFMFLTIL